MRKVGDNEGISSFCRKGEQKHGTVSKGKGWDQERILCVCVCVCVFVVGKATTCFYVLVNDALKMGKCVCQRGGNCSSNILNKREGIESNVQTKGLNLGRNIDTSSLVEGGKAE